MNGSELISIRVKCGGCKKKSVILDASFEAERTDLCNACNGNGGYTCMCSDGQKTVEFTCPKCQYYGIISVI